MNGDQAVTVRRVPGGLIAVPSAYRSAVSVDAQLYAELLDYFRTINREHKCPDLTCPRAMNLLDRLVLRGRLSGVYL